jgi:benzoyl-CoA reductase/2-hydroxyglutaryl-CoA dehydratase subunit BcrC/BadD/HgdB
VKTFAYFDSGHEFPEEIVMAAGFSPVKILGNVHVGTAAADEYLFHYFCPFARGCFAEALENSKKWEGIGFAHGCDATNRHFDVWKAHIEATPFFWVNTPMKVNQTAKTFYRKELMRFIETLNKHYQIKVGEQELKDAIRLSNQVKSLMRQLASLRMGKDIPNSDYFVMTRKAVQTPKELLVEDLKRMLADWERRDPFPVGKIPILLTGSDVTFVEWMELLDTAGFRVVRDDLSLGERYFAATIPDTDDPVEALVTYSCNIPQPATRVPSDGRMEYLLKALNETKIDTVVSQNMKFCEPYALDAVWTVAKMKEKGYDVIHLERDYTPAEERQLLTRLEAFNEIIHQKGGRHDA